MAHSRPRSISGQTGLIVEYTETYSLLRGEHIA